MGDRHDRPQPPACAKRPENVLKVMVLAFLTSLCLRIHHWRSPEQRNVETGRRKPSRRWSKNVKRGEASAFVERWTLPTEVGQNPTVRLSQARVPQVFRVLQSRSLATSLGTQDYAREAFLVVMQASKDGGIASCCPSHRHPGVEVTKGVGWH